MQLFAVGEDSGHDRIVHAAAAVVGVYAGHTHFVGETNVARNGIAVRSVHFSHFPIFHFAQREQIERSGDVAVAVVGHDDQIGILVHAEFGKFRLQFAEQFVLRLQREVIVRRTDAVRMFRAVRIAQPDDGNIRMFLRQNVIEEHRHQIVVGGGRRCAVIVGGIRRHTVGEMRQRRIEGRIAVVFGEFQFAVAIREWRVFR